MGKKKKKEKGTHGKKGHTYFSLFGWLPERKKGQKEKRKKGHTYCLLIWLAA